MKKLLTHCFCGAIALSGAMNSLPAQAQKAVPRTALQRANCAPSDWMKGAGDYLNSKPASGKRPAIFATVTMVSLEPANALAGKVPDRTGVWYAFGEVTRYAFPGPLVLEGKLPLWVNNGTSNAPFGAGQNNTLNITIQGDGQATFNHQVDGRNRMGKGPQSITLGAVASGSSDRTQMFSVATEFSGKKLIVLALTKGEAEQAAAPVVAPKPIGARYKISPSFIVTNSDDGPGDSTVEMRCTINFTHNGKQVGYLARGLDMKKGQRVAGEPFEVVVLDGDPKTLRLYLKGDAYDYDAATKNDPMWRHDMSISIPGTASKKGMITIYPNFIPDDAQGNLDIQVQKVGDVY